MASTSNPAGRLFELLQAGANVPNDNLRLTVREVWAKVFDVSFTDDTALVERLGEVNRLPGEIRRAFESTEVNQEVYLRGLAELEEALLMPLTMKWAPEFITKVQPNMHGLETCSDVLDLRTNLNTMSAEQVDHIRRMVTYLLDELLASEIDANLRIVLIRHAQEMRHAIDDFQILGTEGLRQAAEAAIGGMVVWQQRHGVPTGKAGKVWRGMVWAAGMTVLFFGKPIAEVAADGATSVYELLAPDEVLPKRIGPLELGPGDPVTVEVDADPVPPVDD